MKKTRSKKSRDTVPLNSGTLIVRRLVHKHDLKTGNTLVVAFVAGESFGFFEVISNV